MLKQLPVALALAAGLACASAPAVGGSVQQAAPAAGEPSDVPATWGLMILGFTGAGALLRRERRVRRPGMEATPA